MEGLLDILLSGFDIIFNIINTAIISLFTALSQMLQIILGVLPSLPQMPNDINNLIRLGFSYVESSRVLNFFSYIMGGTTILVVILGMVIISLSFKYIIGLSMFIIKKIPFVNIS